MPPECPHGGILPLKRLEEHFFEFQKIRNRVQTTIVPASTTAATVAGAAAALSPLDSYDDGGFDPDVGDDDFDPGNANLDDSE